MRPADPKPDDDDPGKPALRRGAPPKRPEPVSAPETSVPPSAVATQAPSTTASVKPPSSSTQQAPQPAAPPAPAPVQPPPPPQDDSVIAKAREAAASYTASLPNFFVQQFTTRYQSDDPKHDWHALDIVSADVAYEGGHESYKNIKVGNKAVNKSMDDIEGTRSTGEFSTLLEALLEDGAATFRRKGQDTIRNRSAWVYTFDITRELSRWRIESPSQLYYPAITGSIWIDRETSRVLRIEQQARNMPRGFPFDTTETTADYDFIRLGSTGPFLLPVEAEVLSCIRGTSVCSRNKIEFRNYRKFDSATSITFDDKP
jgi:hypothetical protein